MHIIEQTFQSLKKLNKVAFIPFIVAGHPSINKTEELIYLLEKEGASIIEVGIPFSDPLADGPVIEAVSQRSLENGTKINEVFNCINNVRRKTNVPIVFLVYFNTILAYGVSKFIKRCSDSKVDGLIIPDLPYEERDELIPFISNTDIALIPLVTPTSDDRIEKIVANSKGFVYCVSSLGVTGMREDFNKDIESFTNRVRKHTNLPLAIGFGISNASDIIKFKPLVDGVIVGSALVKKIDDTDCSFEKIKRFLNNLTHPLF